MESGISTPMKLTPTLKSTNLHIWVSHSSRLCCSLSCYPSDDRKWQQRGGGSRLSHSFEGLQYEVGLVDEPVCTDEDIYCPETKMSRPKMSRKQKGGSVQIRKNNNLCKKLIFNNCFCVKCLQIFVIYTRFSAAQLPSLKWQSWS